MVSGVVEDNRAKTDSHMDRNKTFLTFVKTRPRLSPRRMEVCFGRAENALRSISERLQQNLVLLFHLAQKVIKQCDPSSSRWNHLSFWDLLQDLILDRQW